MPEYDVVVVGAGPNGLAAAIACARAGLATLIIEARDTPGGGSRTGELTLPGFHHDVCSAVHPMALASPWFRELELDVDWIHPAAPLAHVLPDGRAVTLERSIDATVEQFGADGAAYRALIAPFAARFDELAAMILGPLRVPRAPILMARFGLVALRSFERLARARFRGDAAPALLAGIAAHSMAPLDGTASTAIAIVLAAAGHAVGWPIARGGSGAITAALVARFRALGGQLALGQHVDTIDQLPTARAYVLDVTPRQLLAIAGDRLPPGYRARLERFRYGPGVVKLDWALRGPVPWRDPRCARAATVHLSGTAADVIAAERAVHAGAVAERPFTLFVQPTLFDPSRAPPGMHVGWAYCHVPHAAAVDAPAIVAAIEAHVEAHAPGFRDLILARSALTPADLVRYNPNYIGGDINAGAADFPQLLVRPVPHLDPYATPVRGLYLCSASTPPGGGVHGMCGYWAARSVLRDLGVARDVTSRRSRSTRPRAPARRPTGHRPAASSSARRPGIRSGRRTP